MKRFPLLFATALLLATASADDQLRDVQAALKTQGFYYGEITGKDSPETTAAIRRYQIRNGIPVTGKLNTDTLAALGFVKKPAVATVQPTAPPASITDAPTNAQVNPPPPVRQPIPRPGEPLTPLQRGRVLPADSDPTDPEPPPPRRALPNDVSAVEPPLAVPAPVSTRLTIMFRDTPYAAATPEVQADIIRRAQSVMAARHVYRGPIDGLAGADTSEAIFAFQDETGLRRTGRLDMNTLAEMELLPQRTHGNPLLKPFYNPNRRRDRSVLPD